MSEKTYRCPCCGKTFTEKDSDKIFINSFMITDPNGMVIAQRMKHIILMDKIKNIEKNGREVAFDGGLVALGYLAGRESEEEAEQ
jgi:RNA polymerase subunit RPABC4/transcription elongation factor Spt4